MTEKLRRRVTAEEGNRRQLTIEVPSAVNCRYDPDTNLVEGL